MAFFNVDVIEDCPTTESKVVGLYFLAETIKLLITLKIEIQTQN